MVLANGTTWEGLKGEALLEEVWYCVQASKFPKPM